MFIHRLSGPHLQVSTCSKLYFVLVFKCLYTDYQDQIYKLVHVVNYTLFWYLNVYTQYQDHTYKLVHVVNYTLFWYLNVYYQDHTYKLVHVVYFVLVFKCLYTDYQDHTYKLVHVVNYTLFWYIYWNLVLWSVYFLAKFQFFIPELWDFIHQIVGDFAYVAL